MYEYKVVDYRLDPFDIKTPIIDLIREEATNGWRIINISETRWFNLMGLERVWTEAIVTYERKLN